MSEPILCAEQLNLVLDAAGRRLHVVRNVDLELQASEMLGLIGESGSGKTMTGLALLRLEPEQSEVTAKTLRLGQVDLLAATPAQMRAVRGRKIAMIFQDPVGAFNPAKRIGWHARAVLVQRGETDWRATALTLLRDVDISDGARVLASYPHQLSGGMLQRVLIALVLAAEPSVIIADEPTTNLDNIVERQILRLFGKVKQRLGAAFIFITHDMAVASTLADRIAVMYAGEIVEIGPTREVFAAPKHPYTKGLIRTAQALTGGKLSMRLPEIPGDLPSPSSQRGGCAFAPRCPECLPVCKTRPIGLTQLGRQPGAHSHVRCLLYENV